MAVVGLIAISLVLMLFNGGIAGVIMLWGFVIIKWYLAEKDKAERMEKLRKYKEDFKKKNGYYPPGL